MRLSIVIACLDAAELLPHQLGALAEQGWQGWWELVVADNGSRDGSRAVAATFAERIERLRVLDASQRRGAQFALNAGVRASLGDAILLLDADDQVAPGYLAAMASALAAHELVAARYDCDSLNDETSRRARGAHQHQGLMNSYSFLPYAGSGGLGFQRQVFDRVGGFDERLQWLYDVDLCWRAQEQGFALSFVPAAVVRVRYRDTGRGMYRQARNWGSVEPYLYRRHRSSGMPRPPLAEVLKGWGRLPVRLPELRRPGTRGYYLRNLGLRVGRLRGSLSSRVMFL